MKFGTGADPVNAIGFQIQRGQLRTTPNAQEHRYKVLTHVDKSVTVIDFGSRLERLSTFKLVDIDKSDYVILANYLDANLGNKVQIEEEYANEKLFTQSVINETADTYFAYITDFQLHGEQEFSSSRRRFDVTVSLSFAGANSGDEINAADSQAIEVLIQIDTTLTDFLGYRQSAQPASGDFTGQRWFDTDDNKLYEWDGSTWELLYTVAADDTDFGFVDGIFYLSAFADLSQDVPNGVDQDHKSGLINAGSIVINDRVLNLTEGPNIVAKTGFSFAIQNAERFWRFVQDNGIAIHGAETKLIFYYPTGTPDTNQYIFGKINRPVWNYSQFKLEVEPFRLNDKGVFPSGVIDDAVNRYIGVKADIIGKTVIRSYGYFPPTNPGLLQNISSEISEITVTAYDNSQSAVSRSDTVISAAINRLTTTEIMINKDDDDTILHYLFASNDLTNINNSNDLFVVSIVSDDKSGSSNPGEVRKILSIDDEVSYAGWYTITLDEAFTTTPDSDSSGTPPDTAQRVNIKIFQSGFRFQTNDETSGGFGENNADGDFEEKIRIFALSENEKELEELTPSGWNSDTASPYNGNLIVLNPRNVFDPSSLQTYQSTKALDLLPLGFNVAPVVGDASGEIDFNTQLSLSLPVGFYDKHTRIDEFTGGNGNPWVYTITKSAATELFGSPSPQVQEEDTEIVRGITRSMIRSIDVRPYGNTGFDPDIFPEGAVIMAMKWSRNINADNEANFLNNTDVKLALNMKIRAILINKINNGTQVVQRNVNSGVKIIIRFKKTDNSYITDASWEKDLLLTDMGIDITPISPFNVRNIQGEVIINNHPNGVDVSDGFYDGATSLSQNFHHQIEGIFANIAARDAFDESAGRAAGDKYWIEDIGAGVEQMQQWNGSSYSAVSINTGEIVYDTGIATGDDPAAYKIAAGPTLDAAVDGTDYNQRPVLSGRNLFDISSLFGGSPLWSSVKEMELLLVSQDQASNQFISSATAVHQNYAITFYEWPHIFWAENTVSTDQQLFASFRGKNLPDDPGTAYAATPFAIVKDIMDDMYPNQWDESSLTTVTNSYLRSSWVWRKQFVDKKQKEEVLKEICRNLWASAIINSDDKIAFVSMFPEDHAQGSPAKTFTDADIIEDSWSDVEYRRADEIFQEYIFGYNYRPSSKFSQAINPYDEVKYGPDDGPTEVTRKSKSSKVISNETNLYRENFDYHYNYQTLINNNQVPSIFKGVMEHLWYNSWRVKFSVPITENFGANSRQVMDYIAVQSYFHTDDEIVEGWIEGLRPDPYNGILEIRMMIPRPPGVFDPLCDYFNDALVAGVRDITGWTDGNGKRNNALTSPRAPVATQKDAGTSPRTFSC